MKRIHLGIPLLGIVISAGLWAHHAAEGIVADDIWNMIDAKLEAAESPHLDIDLDDPGNLAMDADVDPDSNRAVIVTTVNVDFLTDADSVEAAEIIADEFEIAFSAAVSEMSQIPSGTLGYEVEALVDDDFDGYIEYAIITIMEPIGQGNSQDVPVEAQPLAPGKRAGG